MRVWSGGIVRVWKGRASEGVQGQMRVKEKGGSTLLPGQPLLLRLGSLCFDLLLPPLQSQLCPLLLAQEHRLRESVRV